MRTLSRKHRFPPPQAAVDITLTPEDKAELEGIVGSLKVVGDRYNDMKLTYHAHL